MFGLHDNANITFAENETFQLLGDLLKLQPKSASSGSGKTREEIIEETATNLLTQTPPVFNEREVFATYPVLYEQSMNTV